MRPFKVRMFMETTADFALWGELDREPPGARTQDPSALLEDRLPISEDLRDRILAWAQKFVQFETETAPLDPLRFDEEGLWLSRQLQRELGPSYRVKFHFQFAGSRKQLLPLVEGDPVPGWTAS